MRLQALLFSVLCCLSAAVLALPPAVVERVQAPAWVDRGERTLPLAPGLELKSDDVIRTGPGARVYLTLAEGSTVKLGESARMTLYSRSLRPERMFKGALDVAAGAFRFTTDALRRARAQRDISIRVVTATIGIRGTDVWGRAGKDRDLVALIEGQVELSRAGQPLDLLPMMYMDALRGQPVEVKPLALAQLRVLARETEIEAGDGAMGRSGEWGLAFGEYATQSEALEHYDGLRQAGFAAVIRPRAMAAGDWRYALRLGGFANEQEALVAAGRIKASAGIDATAVQMR